MGERLKKKEVGLITMDPSSPPGGKWRRAWRAFLALHSDSGPNALAWTEGIRAAVGIGTPVAVGLLFDHLAWGVLSGFAVLWILSCDLGGAYRQKAIGLTGSALTILLAYLYAGWTSWSVPNYVLGTFLWVFAAALIGVAGNAAAQAGLVSSTIVITSVALIAPGEFWSRLGLCVVGIGWALLLCLALWPLRPYSPLFAALSISCTKLADLTDAFWTGAATAQRSAVNLQFAIAYDGLMSSLEPARKIWGAIRARRSGPTARSRQLLLLIEQLDDLGRTLVTLREIVNLVGKEPWFDEVRGNLEGLTSALTRLGKEVAAAVAVRGKEVDPTPVRHLLQELENRLAQKTGEGTPAALQQKELVRAAQHLVEQFIMLTEIASELKSGRRVFPEPPEAKFGPRRSTF
ncbi:MAG: hypothetical protein JO069_09540, partial [Verrucomicrobia bacterium]|nr:hypothetical protein [Verrucomicrobiota bacterium]